MEIRQIKKGLEDKYLKGQRNIEYGDLSNEEFLASGDILMVKSAQGRFLGYGMITLEQKALGWILSHDEDVHVDELFIKDKILKAFSNREPLYNEAGTNVFRLFNEIGDGIGGLTIDYYDNHYFVIFNSKGVHRYQKIIFDTILTQNPTCIVLQTRFKTIDGMKIHNELIHGDVGFPIIIEEKHLHYYAHLLDGPMTRFFIDQREVRTFIQKMNVQGGQFLNLFAYSGSFSVAAAKNGMTTTSVDLASRTKGLINDNFILNEIPIDDQNIYIMDTFDFLKYAKRKQLSYDVILIDPPSFSSNKKQVFKVERDYPKLIEASLHVLKRGGTLILSQNLETFTLNQFKGQIKRTFTDLKVNYQLKDVKGLPKDFPTTKGYNEGKYLNVITIVVND